MQNDIVKQPQQPSTAQPVVSGPAKPVQDIIPAKPEAASEVQMQKGVKPESPLKEKTSDDLEPPTKAKKVKSNKPVLAITTAFLVCLVLIGLAIYAQMAAK